MTWGCLLMGFAKYHQRPCVCAERTRDEIVTHEIRRKEELDTTADAAGTRGAPEPVKYGCEA